MNTTVRTLFILVSLIFSSAQAGELEAAAFHSTLEQVQGKYLIDVRSQKEWDKDHIAGAALIPHEQIANRIAALVPDKQAPIALFCASGYRADVARKTLERQGYTNVVNLGGIGEARKKLSLPN